MFFLNPFALRSSPFSWVRFGLYMAGLAALTAGSIAGDQKVPAPTAATMASGNRDAPAPTEAEKVETVRLCTSEEDLRGDLPRLGVPWFLRRQGATARFERRGETDIAIEVAFQGKTVGDFVERLTALDEDRTMLEVGFVPKDMDLLAQLAKPIETGLDPNSLMRVVMAEHVRSSVMGGGFDFNVLTETPGSAKSAFRKAFIASASGQRQNGGTIDCPKAKYNANIRRAYREEGQKAGANANRL